MGTKRVIALSAAALGLAAVVAAAPAAAAPQQAPGTVEPATSKSCAIGAVRVKTGWNNVPVRQWPSDRAPIWESYDAGQTILCIADRYSLGERYDACGGDNANGYLIVGRGGDTAPVGYVYMTCVND